MRSDVGNKSELARDLLLGNIKHPLDNSLDRDILNAKNFGRVKGAYEQKVHYQSMIIAAQYLMIMHDEKYRKVIKANLKDFMKITENARGYYYDEELKTKHPLDERPKR